MDIDKRPKTLLEKNWDMLFEPTPQFGIKWIEVPYEENPPLTAVQLHCNHCNRSFFVVIETADIDDFLACKFTICPLCGNVNKKDT